ncbi:MAG: hypothetical protein IPJ61_20885 [Tessaracoccus sp.]|uniref:hypothetical protein n=1 Tax=Tessaracoccus sp. TaxID=1971211 RepID=UPI001EC0FFD5|nr:hypothetical protein [Tessaracoccus sp.]MBK7823446.1 hypothetical protein [Tessaracoccus sp.]
MTTCPRCGDTLAGNVKPHCDGRTCGWIICRGCAERIDRKSRHFAGPSSEKEKP